MSVCISLYRHTARQLKFFDLGKTFSAEATSEHVKRPLYVIGGGDLGTRASDLDAALERIFDIATAWKAIVLIDEVCPMSMG